MSFYKQVFSVKQRRWYLGFIWPGAQEQAEHDREELTCRAWNLIFPTIISNRKNVKSCRKPA